jgi:tetratricopeptide (TPR) repeat protein
MDTAWKLASEDRTTEAETLFARAVVEGEDENSLYQYGEFLRRLGRLSRATQIFHRLLVLAEQRDSSQWRITGFNALAAIHEIRGDLERAEELYRKALTLNEEVHDKSGLARDYSNLGSLSQLRGDLQHAEELYRKGLSSTRRRTISPAWLEIIVIWPACREFVVIWNKPKSYTGRG